MSADSREPSFPERNNFVKKLIRPADNFTQASHEYLPGYMEARKFSYEGKKGKKKSWVLKTAGDLLFVKSAGAVTAYPFEEGDTTDSLTQLVREQRNIDIKDGDSFRIDALEMRLNEVIAGEFAILVFGKDNSPATALVKKDKLMVASKIKSSDCVGLFDFVSKRKSLEGFAFSGFSEILALKILLGDSDIKLDSFVAYNGGKSVYGIDWEQSFIRGDDLEKALAVLKSPKEMTLQICEVRINLSSIKASEIRAGRKILRDLSPKIKADKINLLITKLANLPEEHIRSIGTRLKEQCAENGVVLEEKTAAFVDGRIGRLLEIKRACQLHIAAEKAPSISSGFQAAVVQRAAAERGAGASR